MRRSESRSGRNSWRLRRRSQRDLDLEQKACVDDQMRKSPMSTKLEGEAVVGLAPNANALARAPIRQASRAAFELSLQPATRPGSCARHDCHRSPLLSRPWSIATSGGPPDRIAPVLRRASGSRISAGEKRPPRAGNPALRHTLSRRWDRVCAIIFARPGLTRLNPEAEFRCSQFFRLPMSVFPERIAGGPAAVCSLFVPTNGLR